MKATEKISVVLPARNELENLRALLPAISSALDGHEHEILIIDDNSSDGTGEFLEHFADGRVRHILRTERRGLGSAIGEGIANATGDVLIIMDSDFNHSPDDLPRLIDGLRSAEFVSGSRFVPGSRSDHPGRDFLSLLFNYFIRAALASRLTDHLFGFCALRKNALEHTQGHTIFHGFGDYYIRLLHCFERAGVVIVECPVHHRKRHAGQGNRKLLKTALDYSVAVARLAREGRP